ncbi:MULTISPECIES: hypothetical protein [Acinetobacter]|uniref:hypothetical protein n=1 Tax=Acinetobacter TaxID=469 RepID=UPI0002CDAB9E|nr:MULTISPECIES: hypothetical protein [Acinetobacter]ENW29301.1 hypothetical protein F924_00864 [Acinetobacter lwoffii ATCC 9957 = CIP 70.31]ENX31652.1 hypothetical protein F890_00845 [Acinetobacter sp. CIP 64.7]MEB6681010.1 hypothetical protein [Acinetobacter lwoffii]
MSHYLEFDAFDNPMQLSKVGNWVITFLSPVEELQFVQLAITYVLPRQISDSLQPRLVLIQKSPLEHHWLIQAIECFDSTTCQEISLSPEHTTAQQTLAQILKEFEKYDVNLQLKQI